MNAPVNETVSFTPRARRDHLRVQIVADELLVFDTQRDEAHVLNRPAAFVWQNADGTHTIQEIARAMTVEFGAPADVQTVRYALEQLDKKQLLVKTARPFFTTPPHVTATISRPCRRWRRPACLCNQYRRALARARAKRLCGRR